ncbi:MAG: integrase arm-type DNA-binding domain-containing protein [Pseudolabrys sp.]|nr:integrase arm-type DNA-binding domain-containing protein [Pseudolabrys sp.]
MARAIERLSEAKIRNAKPVGRSDRGKPRTSVMLCDGGGLYLQATLGREGNVRRSWIFRYKRPGYPSRDMGLGSFNDIGLAEAREMARECRKLVKEGLDPIEHRNTRVARNLAASSTAMTFAEAAETYIRQHRAAWKNAVHAAQWPASLKTYVFPIIGKLPVSEVSTPHVIKVLERIWHEKPETASRIRGRIESILGWATVSGHRDGDNPARWRGHLDKRLPSRTKVRQVRHQKSLPYTEMPAFMVDLRQRRAIAALALEFAILTCVRTSDVRKGKWAQIDRAQRIWTIPELSKIHREHRVPLSRAALTVLDKAQQITREIGGHVAQSEYLFPNDLTGASLSENALLALLQRMGRKGMMTTHGCRATFRTWAQERTNFPWEIAELSLGHTVGTKVERAYARGDALQKRIAIMQAWADFCARPQPSHTVVALHTVTR